MFEIPLDNMIRAIAFRELKPDNAFGAAHLAARRSIEGADIDALTAHYAAEARETIARFQNLEPGDMPPDTDDLALLVDVVAFRHGLTSRAEVWRTIGVTPNTGRGYFGRNRGAVTWPIWFTLMAEAGLRGRLPR